MYRFYQEKIVDCDVQLRKQLESFGSAVDIQAQPIGPKPKGKKGSRNAPQFDLRTELYSITRTDWAQINGIDVLILTAQTVIAEARGPERLSQREAVRQLAGFSPHQ